MANDFDKSCVTLPSIRAEEWNGLVFINFDPDAAPFAGTATPQRGGAAELLVGYQDLHERIHGDATAACHAHESKSERTPHRTS
jgi:phenylpropionate dioxygenase-like ring-hydroxylating dioxygenase large terminal subunit